MHSSRPLFRLVIACSLVGFSVSCAGQSPANSTESSVGQLWQDASAAQKAQQFSEAAELYRRIVALEPGLTEAQVNLGLMYQLTGDLHAAIASFQQALKKSPALYAPNLLIGLDYLKLDNPAAALVYLQRAVTAKPGDTKALIGLANSYLQLRQYTEAQQQFSHAIDLDSKNADAWYGLGATYLSIEKQDEERIHRSSSPFGRVLLGESYLQQGRAAKAVKVLKSIFDTSAANAPCAHSLLGFAYLRDTKFDEAAQQFQADWNAQTGSGCLLAKLGFVALDADRSDADGALRELREAAEIDPVFVRSNAALFWNDLVKAGPDRRASEVLERQSSPTSQSPSLKLADHYWNIGQYSACSTALAAASGSLSSERLRLLSRCSYYVGQDALVLKATGLLLKATPDDPEALYWRIESAERLGLGALTKATEINPDSASLHVLLGDMLRGKGDFAEAANEYRKAIILKPEFLAARIGLARVLYADGNDEGAVQELQYVLKANSSDPEASYQLGEMLVSRQEFAAAQPLLETALHAAPEELPHVHAALSKVYAERGEVSRAIAEIKLALPADVDGSYYYRLGRLYMQAGDRAASAQAMQQSARMHRQDDASTLPDEER
jgi:tetratricopeptide (TPR) repeat protein